VVQTGWRLCRAVVRGPVSSLGQGLLREKFGLVSDLSCTLASLPLGPAMAPDPLRFPAPDGVFKPLTAMHSREMSSVRIFFSTGEALAPFSVRSAAMLVPAPGLRCRCYANGFGLVEVLSACPLFLLPLTAHLLVYGVLLPRRAAS